VPWVEPRKLDTRGRPMSVPSPPYPKVEVSEACGYNSLDDVQKNPAQLWGCFGEAYDVAVHRLVIDLEKIRPPVSHVNASTDTPSGTSTR
jgi:hypothetical protein